MPNFNSFGVLHPDLRSFVLNDDLRPPPIFASFGKMTRVHDFVSDLAKAGKSSKEILDTVNKTYGDEALKLRQIQRIISKVRAGGDTDDQRHKNPKKTKRTTDIIESVKAMVEEDRRVNIEDISNSFGLSYGTAFNILHCDLRLVKKSARWVPKLLSSAQKEERVRCAEAFRKSFFKGGKAFLQSVVTMDETAVPFSTPETKIQSRQWLPKGSPAPTKAKVAASRKKQMVITFFDSEGLIYTNYVPLGQGVNAAYFVTVLASFLKNLKNKRPHLVENGWFLHMDNCPAHSAKITKEFLAKKSIKTIPHPPYSPDLAPADYFLFPKVKSLLAGTYISSNSVKTDWERVAYSIPKEDFATAFDKWVHRFEVCEAKEGNFVEK